MLPPTVRPADLDENSLERLRNLEQELGSVIVAYKTDSPFAHLSEDQLQRLKALEQELGVVLLAFKTPVPAS
ncbi:MAG: hypothetical protein RMK84_05720 [Oscillochloridaceae bacterium]|nr:hypothetical protein [Chloroflexaceae bacterium]MDW8389602.1 hypothetical protein [Oscillochloridaceae bacterium]